MFMRFPEAPKMPVKVESKVEGEIYTHRVLWRTARLQADNSSAGQVGANFSRLAAITMAFATIEAYANFLLQIFDPKRCEKERKAFNGVAHKISEVMSMVGLQARPKPAPLQYRFVHKGHAGSHHACETRSLFR
jgi:hypothetical protein